MADSANSISCKQTCHHTADTAESAVYLTLIYRLFGEAGRTTSAGVAICCAIFVAYILVIVRGYRNEDVSGFLAIERTF
jgi:hypothetical protein